MTNHWVDIKNADVILIMGGNAAEAHPCGFKWVTEAKEHNNAHFMVVDPRFNRSASVADFYAPIRSGSDIPFLFGLVYHIFKNGWEDKQYIRDRVFGMDKVREEVMAKWTPDKVEEACGVKEEQVFKVAKMLHVHHSRVKEWATRTDDPLPFRIFPGMRRGAFISREDLYAWLSENTVLASGKNGHPGPN